MTNFVDMLEPLHKKNAEIYAAKTGRGDAAATTWIFRGDGVAATPRPRRGSRRRRGRDVDIPRRRSRGDAAAATSILRRGHRRYILLGIGPEARRRRSASVDCRTFVRKVTHRDPTRNLGARAPRRAKSPRHDVIFGYRGLRVPRLSGGGRVRSPRHEHRLAKQVTQHETHQATPRTTDPAGAPPTSPRPRRQSPGGRRRGRGRRRGSRSGCGAPG